MADETRTFTLNYETNAQKATGLVSALERTLTDMGSSAELSAKGLNSASRGILSIEKSLTGSSRSLKDFTSDLKKVESLAKSKNSLAGATQEAKWSGMDNLSVATEKAAYAQNNLTAAQRAYDTLNPEAGIERQIAVTERLATATRENTTAQGHLSRATQEASAASDGFSGSLPTLRYALYDVSMTLGIAGAAMTAFSALSLKSAIDYERSFADVVRTNDTLMNSAVASERAFGRFVDMAGELPLAFSEITEIGTLAGQLGVATGRMDDFTRATAMFSATTGESIDTTATAFGRLDALLPDVQGNYEALGSSILNVGINSVATEGEVIKITTQLAGVGRQAGLTADQVIGLSGALASVGVQPELARGTITRLFGQISRAVAVGGDNLQGFATIAGTTAGEFSSKWGSDAMGATLDVFRGIRDRGADAESALRAVGITSVRDVPAILRLSQTMDSVLVPALQDAEDGFRDGTQLADNYGIIAETTSAKLQIFANNIQSLLAALGDSASAFGGVIDAGNEFLTFLRKMQDNPITAFLSQTAVLVTGLSGVLLVGLAAVVRLRAGMLAWQTAMQQAGVTTTGLSGQVMALTGALSGANAQATAGAGSMGRLSTSMRTAGAAAGVLVAIPISQWLTDWVNESRGAVLDVETLTAALSTLGDAANEVSDLSAVIDKSAESLGKSTQSATWLTSLVSGGGQTLSSWVKDQFTDAEAEQQAGLLRLGQNFTVAGQETFFTSDSFGLLSFLDESNRQVGEWSESFIAAWESAANETQKQAILDAYNDLESSVVAAGGSAEKMRANFADFHDVVGDGVNVSLLAAEAHQIEADSIEALADEMSSLVDDVYSSINAQYDLFNALADVGEAFYNEGAAVAFTGSAMQNAVKSIIETSGGAGSAAANLQVFFDYLVQGGYASASQLTHLQSVIAGLLKSAGGKVSAPTLAMPDFKAFQVGMQRVQTSSSGAAKSVRDVGKAAKETRKEVRTLLDYASDLSGMWSRAFDFRFDRQSTLDTITTAFRNIKEEAEEAAKRIRDLKNDMASLTSDIGIQEYYLSIAVEYGDTTRATAIEAELAKKRAELADKSAELQAEQSKLNKTLVGTSSAAIDNRKTITDLVEGYQAHLKALAESGVSQGALVSESERLRAEFLAQGQALGFSASELSVYGSSFTDIARIINATPFNVTVDLSGLDPAIIAIREFTDKANAALSTIGTESGLGGGGGGGVGSGIPSGIEDQLPNVGLAGLLLGDAARNAFMTATKAPFTKEYAGTVYDSLMAGEISVDEAAGRLGLSGEQEFMKRYGAVLPADFEASTAKGIKAAIPRAGSEGSALGNTAGSGTNLGFGNKVDFAPAIQSKASLASSGARSNGSTLGSIIADGLRSGISWALDMSLGGANSKNRNIVRAVTGFQSGGYTGPGAASQVAGVAHAGEYYFRKDQVNQSTGLPKESALLSMLGTLPSRSTAPASSGSGGGMQTVALSAGSIQALAQATGKNIYLDGKLVAESSAGVYAQQNTAGAF